MTTGSSGLLRIAGTGASVCLLTVSAWGLFGVVLLLVWLLGDQGDWSTVGYGWLTIFWLLAALGVVCRYWLPRWELHRRGDVPIVHIFSRSGLAQVLSHGMVLPFCMVVYLVRDVDDSPTWAVVLGAAVTVIGVGAFVDSMVQLTQRGWKARDDG